MKSKEDGKIAKRYARALFELCEQADLEAIAKSLDDIAKAWVESAELRSAVLNPGLKLTERRLVLRDLAGLAASKTDLIGNFLCVLLDNGRVSALPHIAKEFSSLLAALRKTLALEVMSAYPVEQTEQAEILNKLKQECGSLVSIAWKVDQDLIGGLVIRAGDKVLDNTVRGSLEKIRQSLMV